MRHTDTVVIGGGQAGLAASRCLSDRAIDHVVLERGRVGERWRSERWDSLRMLTPRWQSRLPSFEYEGPDPDGYMTMSEVIGWLEQYARASRSPVETGTTVRAVRSTAGGYHVTTNRGAWMASNVVVATGHCDVPLVPGIASGLDPAITQVTPSSYRAPGKLPPGGVLVVGASASGAQIADELARSGRDVTIAVGRHTRLPRTYRGRDVMWWMDRVGILDDTPDDVANIEASRRQPSLQLVGAPRSLDLDTLRGAGVRLVGRATAACGQKMAFGRDLSTVVASAEARRARLLARVDAFIDISDLNGAFPREDVAAPIDVPASPPLLDLRREGIGTVVWATGFRRSYPWLEVPVLDDRGEIVHQGGVTPLPGLYVLGLPFLRRRKSTYLDGVGDDARAVIEHLARRRIDRSAA